MAKLTVHKRGYTRKAFVKKGYTRRAYRRKDGVYVKSAKVKKAHVGKAKVPATTFKITDRGKRGRGKKTIPTLKRGSLGVNFKNSANVRRQKEAKKAKMIGERAVVGKLRAIQVLNKRTNPAVSRKALADSKYIAGSFKGKKRVKYPAGFRKRKR